MMNKLADGNFVDATGCLTIRETAAVIEHAKVFLGNDSGPMHMAAALQVPCVIISCHPSDGDPNGHNSPVRFGPVGDKHTVLCPSSAQWPCSRECRATSPHCICNVNEQDVTEAVLTKWLGEDNE
jgi:ADP-heptose:LPS heptosyltransferase